MFNFLFKLNSSSYYHIYIRQLIFCIFNNKTNLGPALYQFNKIIIVTVNHNFQRTSQLI